MARNNTDIGATALLENDNIGQLYDLVLAKLTEEILGRLPSKQLALTKFATSILPYRRSKYDWESGTPNTSFSDTSKRLCL